MYKFSIAVCLWLVLLCTACNSNFTPKATGYPAIQLPQKNYLSNRVVGMPYSFDIPAYSEVDNHVVYMGKDQHQAGWMNLKFPSLHATLYVSYNPIQKGQLEVLVRDAFNFANNHANKANFIEDSAFINPEGSQGIFFHLGGDVASPYQFFITDSSRHFLRGALYFDTTPNADSLAPVIDFIYQDLKQLVSSFRWKS
ncbi:MAG: gliding motility lipoprotein GldD [Bacteroidota bacterium]|jgi:gliding motility-associated lipoprotein GldD